MNYGWKLKQNITGAVIHPGGQWQNAETPSDGGWWQVYSLRCRDLRCNIPQWCKGRPSHPPLADVLMWTTDEVNLTELSNQSGRFCCSGQTAVTKPKPSHGILTGHHKTVLILRHYNNYHQEINVWAHEPTIVSAVTLKEIGCMFSSTLCEAFDGLNLLLHKHL